VAKVSWQTLAVKLPSYTETQIKEMLDEEIGVHKRVAIARRLHQRLCKLRSMRERKEIIRKMKK
jgi:hypothetical protein